MTSLGTNLVISALAATLVSIILYVLALFRGPVFARLGRAAFIVAALSILGVSIVHSTLLMTHRFDVGYVYHYSARALPTQYLFATFWAGQEGSFLLWTFWTALLGTLLAFKAGKAFESRVMPIYGTVLAFLLLLLVIKSPFLPYHPINPGDPLHPTDGQGLNPLLENYWMVIHPPTLFLGFASLAIPFSYTIAALIWRDPEWYRRTWPWALFSFAVLGFGVMLGGKWAYETLGWGGFWGWDPVENGPLVPWLGMTAFLHAAQVQRVRGSLKRTTLFLGFFPFVAALYETFLTRTGILDKFSVHSFSTLGGPANSAILYGLLSAVVISLVLLLWQGGRYENESSAWDDATSKEFGYTLAIIILMVCAVITGAGMSAPLITQGLVNVHLLANQSSVQPTFYNKANFPVAVLLAIGMGIGPFLAWKKSTGSNLLALQYTYPSAVGLTALSMFFAFKGGFRIPAPQLILLASSIFAVIANGQVIFAQLLKPAIDRAPIRTMGGHFAHIGSASLLLGIICLVCFTRSDQPILVKGHTRELENLPYSISYRGMTSTLRDPKNDLEFTMEQSGGGKPFTALMPLAVRDVEGTNELLARPAIFHKWWGDLYIALKDGPEELSPSVLQKFTLGVGQSSTIDGYTIRFNKFYVDPVTAAQVQSGIMPKRFPVSANLTVISSKGMVSKVAPQYIRDMTDPLANGSPELMLSPKNSDSPWAVAFTGMDAAFGGGGGQAEFYIRDASIPTVEAYTIEVSTRPGIWLVWLGTVLIAFGGLLGMRRRLIENRLIPIADPDTVNAGNSTGDAAAPRSSKIPYSGKKPVPAAMKSSR